MLAVMGAMEEEIALFREAMDDVKKNQKAGLTFYQGKIDGKKIILVHCGIGKVNAAICTQILIDDYGVDNIIFTGVAGALAASLDVLDVVVSTDCIQHDLNVHAFGYEPGTVPRLNKKEFAADDALVQLALESGKNIEGFPQIIQGRILSGDEFIADKDRALNLADEFNGHCVEMEGAAVAQACYLNNIPFVIIRAMSDKADGTADVDFPKFVQKAANNSLALVREMLKNL
ncbi:5'-methylthioadenosine/adenosylhomocysteine nucleosidase [Proteinivorax hydrogeniformans]|uniref:adenosylhomocysteine nucleosidase n=1 Tax=Proteinivorax hydrogeniformans TaxID=1826727 RepID=A0AAU8HTH7_9FIRM